MTKAKEVKLGDLSPNDIVVALIGPTGAGMSTFVSIVTAQDKRTVGHNLQPFTTDFRAFKVDHPRTRQPIVFIDTPGFDSSQRSDSEILRAMAEHMRQKTPVKLSGIIYLHRISDNRKMTSGPPFKNLRMLCGKDPIPNIVLVTTMWGQVTMDIGRRREKELREIHWKAMLANGSIMMRFMDSYESAWDIVDTLVSKSSAMTLLPEDSDQTCMDRVGVGQSKRVSGHIATREISNSDFLIVMFGAAGAGKSSFIKTASNLELSIGHSLEACTTEIQVVKCTHPHDKGRSIVFVDTPAPSDDQLGETSITDWMDMLLLRRRSVDGILYMHRISDLRMTHSLLAHIQTFEKFGGPHFPRKILFLTTMWDIVDPSTGQRREDELRTNHWKSMMAQGSTMKRFENTSDSAWHAIDHLIASTTSTTQTEGQPSQPEVIPSRPTEVVSSLPAQANLLSEISDWSWLPVHFL